MKLSNLHNETAVKELHRNMVNAAVVGYSQYAVDVAPLRWGAAHRSAINAVRSALAVDRKCVMPPILNNLVRQVVDAVEWIQGTYVKSSPGDLQRASYFLQVSVLEWMQEHLVEVLTAPTPVVRTGNNRRIGTFNTQEMLNIIAKAWPDGIIEIDACQHISRNQVHPSTRIITPEILTASAVTDYRVRPPRHGHYGDLNSLKKSTMASGTMLVLASNTETRTVSCIMPRKTKAEKHHDWYMFNVPTEKYRHYLKLALPTVDLIDN